MGMNSAPPMPPIPFKGYAGNRQAPVLQIGVHNAENTAAECAFKPAAAFPVRRLFAVAQSGRLQQNRINTASQHPADALRRSDFSAATRPHGAVVVSAVPAKRSN